LHDTTLLSLEQLRDDGALLGSDFEKLPSFDPLAAPDADVREVRSAFLILAARRFLNQCTASPLLHEAMENFCEAQSAWLDDWALRAAARWENDGVLPLGISQGEAEATGDALLSLDSEIEELKVLQFLLHRQWMRIHRRAAELGVTITTSHAVHRSVNLAYLFGDNRCRFQWNDFTDEVMHRLLACGTGLGLGSK
jgi:4-alpha-glucanotransferase